MPEKSRIVRKHEAMGLTEGSARHDAKETEDLQAVESSQRHLADIEEQLANSRQELEKALKISRSLARNCARAEQEMRRSEESFALVFRHGSDLVFRLGRDGKFQELSPACQALFGLPSERLTGRFLQEFVAKEDLEPLRRYFQNVLRGPVAESTVIHIPYQGRGCRAVEMHCRAVPHPQTQVLEILGIAHLRPLLQAAASSQEDLAFSLAHELNQPLTALAIAARACSQLARVEEVDTQELMLAIDQLAGQAERAGELVRRMRQLAARGTPHWTTVAVAEITHAAVAMMAADLERAHVRTELHIPEEVPIIRIDRIQIEQVLVNLIRNAVEAMSDLPADQRLLTITVSRKEAEVVVAITDTGPGLSPAIAERLFQPYQTTKPQGMGLGLAVSRAILQAHAGRLWVEPPRGSGTTFCLALPLASRES